MQLIEMPDHGVTSRPTGRALDATASEPAPRPWLSHVGVFAGAWFRSFALTCLGMVLLGIALGALSATIVGGGWHWRWSAAGIAFAACALAAFPLGAHRATTAALVHAVCELRAPSQVLGLLFDRFMQSNDAPSPRVIELTRLTEVEAELRRRLHALLAPPGDAIGLRAWIRRRLYARLEREIARVTLAELRRAAGEAPDLPRLRAALCDHADRLVEHRLRRASRRLTVGIVTLLCAGVLVLAGVMRWGVQAVVGIS